MRCEDAERLILETGEKEWSPDELRALEAHLEWCQDCAAFRDFRVNLLYVLEKTPAPHLDTGLVEKVRLRCHAELDMKAVRGRARVPWSILTAFGILTVITLGFFIPQILDFFSTKEFTPEMGLLLAILLQNTVMLFFAPVIMRRQRVDHNGWRECR